GKNAEQKAKSFLQTQGLILIEQNYRSHHGEIDLIMRDKDDIVFIEVRCRSRTDYGNPSESVTISKQMKIIKTAAHFLQKKGWLYKVNSRFDVVALVLAASEWKLDWIKNAFLVKD